MRKLELHAHLNGSLSKSTMLLLKRLNADSGIKDETNTFMDEFVMGAGDTRSLSDCFQIFSIAHALTTTPQALQMATSLTLREFQDDGCCYIELRSTPRDTPHMNKNQYVDAIVKGIKNPENLIISRLIISINRTMVTAECDAITDLAIEYHKKYPDIVVGIELSGNPIVGEFQNFLPALTRARDAGLKVSLHCGEVRNPKEVLDMINFKPERLGHGVCIHPKFGGTQETWQALCNSLIPVELCLTSNVNTKSVSGYESHHFKELYEAGIPVIINTDDKGVFATSLSQEYMLCAETFHLEKEQIARLALSACQYIFDTECRDTVKTKVLEFMNKHYICSY
ncbi:adenosine deaminase-like protein isoform X2 [Plodia interpunctella]|uniref:adenosine deaminase-like protein isoform X2 n=1 Tax=Plodia interpunctella TaxID=58824 RepID=UPI0023675CF3|nr:adenosine deaminase-like protein isoform X2 [Plodia interpunctella]